VRRELLATELIARFLGIVDGVPESLREPVDGLSGTEQIKPDAAFVERTLGGLAGAVELLF